MVRQMIEYPSAVGDRVLAAMGEHALPVFHLELGFGHALDVQRLVAAFERLLDAEPLLGCRFVEGPLRARWRRLEPAAREIVTVVEGDAAYEGFKAESIDPATGPQLRVCLQRRPAGDRLALKICHLVSDSGGMMQLTGEAAALYARLAREPGHRPPPAPGRQRSPWPVVRGLPWRAYPQIWLNFLRESYENLVPPRTHALPLEAAAAAPAPGEVRYVLAHLPAERVERIRDYGRRRGATLNDMLLAAFFRAQVRLGAPHDGAALRLTINVDLRRYLPDAPRGVCNLSQHESVVLGRELGDDLDATLRRVRAVTARRKGSWPGLNPLISLLPLWHLPYPLFRRLISGSIASGARNHSSANGLTNTGVIDPAAVSFDGAPKSAWMIMMPLRPPLFGVAASSYRGALTLSAGELPAAMTRVTTARFFEALAAELPE
jgi:NRPS condensation-like uncharacterized protein